MTRYYAVIDDVFYDLGKYRTINEARKRAEIEADRMKQTLSNVITATELWELEEEYGEQIIIDLDELYKAVNTIKSVCDKFGNCNKCPFDNNDECSMDCPYNWGYQCNDVICNIGDTIYQIPINSVYESHILNNVPEQNRVYEMQVTSVEREGDRYKLKYLDYYSSCYSDFYGKTWFLTREEADKALEELGQKYLDNI